MTDESAGRSGQQRIQVGKIVAHFGLEGWLKIESYTEPRERILDYRPLYVGSEAVADYRGRTHGRGLLIRIPGRDDRESAAGLIGRELWIDRQQLPATAPGEYYWSDLEGCRVVNAHGHNFGAVKQIIATGGNDVLVVAGQQETLIPFVPGTYVLEVALKDRRIVVDWEPDYL